MPCIQGVLAIRYGLLGENCHAVGKKADSFGCGRTTEAHAVVADGRHADREERDGVPDTLTRHPNVCSQPGMYMNVLPQGLYYIDVEVLYPLRGLRI